MHLNIFKILLIISLVNLNRATTEGSCSRESKEKEQLCATYCYKVVKPLLNYATLIRSKEEQFAELEDKIRDQEGIIVGLREMIKQKEIQLTQQIELTVGSKKHITVQDELLAALKVQLTTNNDQITKLKSEDNRKDSMINTKETELKQLQSQIKSNSQLLSTNAKKLEQYESKLKEINKAASCLGKATYVHTIRVPETKTFLVPCDSQFAGSGWTVIQRRVDGSVHFNRSWDEYKAGFGNWWGNYFIGLEKLHLLTQMQPHELYVQLEDFHNETRYAKYNNFVIGTETESYEIKQLGQYSGNANDALKYHLNQKFSTPDRDTSSLGCAKHYNSGWWFSDCFYCNLNGVYTLEDVSINEPQISWNEWEKKPLKFTQMMIRPENL